MQTKPLIAALAAAALAFPLAATAGGTGKHMGDKAATNQSSAQPAQSSSAGNSDSSRHSFVSLDANSDGTISKEEFAASAQASQFATLDKDGDGKLSRSEHASAQGTLTSEANRNSANGSTSATTGSTSSAMPSSGTSSGTSKPQ